MAFGLLKLKSSKVVINNRPTVPKVPTKKCILAMNVIYFKISNFYLFLQIISVFQNLNKNSDVLSFI